MSTAKGKGSPEKAPAARVERRCVLDRNCLEDLRELVKAEPKVAKKALEMMEFVLREPHQGGPGKPEPLKGLPNTWSRRLTSEHRLVYVVFDDRVVFLAARYHYGD